MILSVQVAVALVVIYLVYHYVLYPTYISPLSKIPSAHPTSSFLPTWLWWMRRIGRESRSIFAAHQRHGPIVRLAPNEVSVASLDGLRKIYVGGFRRSDWFLLLRNYDGTPNLVSMLDNKQHAAQRRFLSHVYSKSYLLGSSDFQTLARVIIFERLFPVLDDAARTGQSVDVYELCSAVGAEFMSAYEMGIGNGYDLVRQGRENERRRHVERATRKLKYLEWGGIAAKELEQECLDMCKNAEDFLRRSSSESKQAKSTFDEGTEKAENNVQKTSEPTSYPVVYAQLSASIRGKQTGTSEEIFRLIASELIDHIEAARGGIGITLTYAMYHLSQQSALQSTLRKELEALKLPLTYPAFRQTLSTSTLRQFDNIPLLDAIITETLRLYPTVPGPLRRTVPEGGTVIENYFIPADVLISSSPYCLHHHEAAYPKAELWKPERWMRMGNAMGEKATTNDGDDGELENGRREDDPRRWFWAFGSGSTVCIGNNLSLLGKYLGTLMPLSQRSTN